MATWRDKVLASAKFRGVEFLVEVAERSGGRHTVEHVYPFREDPPYHEDMGRKGNAYSIEAFFVGDDYLDQRDKLLKELEKSGPGELVHPYHGTVKVQLTGDYRLRESTKEGGFATISLTFSQTSTATEPASVSDGKAAVKVSADDAKSGVQSEFSAVYAEVTAAVSTVTGALQGMGSAVRNITSRVGLLTQAAAKISAAVQDLEESAAQLAGTPDVLLSTVVELVDMVAAGVLEAGGANPSAAILALYDFDAGTRPSDEARQGNYDATKRLVQRLALVQGALAAIEQTFDSYDAAVVARSRITALIDEQAELVSDDTYPTLQQLRADLVAAVPGEDGDLPRLQNYTPEATAPSLVLANALYGDLEHEADLLARNRIVHPGFVAGGVELEVLTRG